MGHAQVPSPGVEPGLSRPQRDVLTTRRWGLLPPCSIGITTKLCSLAGGHVPKGLLWELSPGPPATRARIMPLDQAALIQYSGQKRDLRPQAPNKTKSAPSQAPSTSPPPKSTTPNPPNPPKSAEIRRNPPKSAEIRRNRLRIFCVTEHRTANNALLAQRPWPS